MSASTLVGSVGVGMLLAAFTLNLIGTLPNSSIGYRLLNVVGAALACIASILIEFAPFVVLEGAWLLVGLVALLSRRAMPVDVATNQQRST